MKLVTVAIFENAAQAHAAKSLLDLAGVQSVITDEELVSQLWHIGAFNGIKLQVVAEDEKLARRTLHDAGESPERVHGAPWRCIKCQEVIEADFEVCWSCGAAREEAADPDFDPNVETESPASSEQFTEDEPWSRASESIDPNNPYVPAHVRDDEPDSFQMPAASDAVEDLVVRAWRASVIGLGLCPGILHVYSIGLLMSAGAAGAELSAMGKLRFVCALLIDLLVLGVGALFFLGLLNG